ncbi:MAG: 50S ribosomal protein L21 [Candidatus Komeilibacteria bacterium]|nr:50S ribosomal protein L21 [Candidatus Komeilibacteria bacterium]
MSIAVIKTGGKQYLVKPGDKVKVEKLVAEEGKSFEFEQVLLRADEKGKKVELGFPILEKKLNATPLRTARGKKITVIKYKNKIRYRRKTGHRQTFTELEIGAF